MKISRYTESLQYNLEAAARILQEAISTKFKEFDFGLSYDEFIILDEIYHTPGILQIELAKRILKGRAYTGKFITVLEEKGFVERRKEVKGKTQVILPNYITKKGIDVHQVGVKVIKEYIGSISTIKKGDAKSVLAFLSDLKSEVENKYNVKFV